MKMWRLTIADTAAGAVIGLAAILLLVPARLHGGKYGAEAVCLANVRGLLQAWNMYHEDNDGRLVGGSNYYSGTRRTPYRWVERPLYSDADNPGAPPEGLGSMVPPDAALSRVYRLNGIRAGKLFPYVENVKLYHCPADRALFNREPNASYRSYSISGLMNSEDFTQRDGWPGYVPPSGWRAIMMPDGKSKRLKLAQQFHEIASPERKHVFVEEDVAIRNQLYNLGGFILMGSGYWYWWDVPATFHDDRAVLGFADGHAVSRRWADARTIALIKQEPLPGTSTIPGVHQPNNADLEYMNGGYMACD